MKNDLIKYVTSLGVTDRTAQETIAHDVLTDPKAVGYEIANARYRTLDYFKKVKLESKRFCSLDEPSAILSDEQVSLYEVIPYHDENEISAALQENQRQLIERLVDDADERTTLIVQTFLTLDKPTVNKVAAKLNIHHVTVQRALTRLQRNYSENQYGYLSDYLSA